MERQTTDDHEMPETTLRDDDILVQSQGKLQVNDDLLDHLGLDAGDLIVVRLLLDEPVTFTRELDTRRRVTVPHYLRDEHDVEEGDRVDVEVGAP